MIQSFALLKDFELKGKSLQNRITLFQNYAGENIKKIYRDIYLFNEEIYKKIAFFKSNYQIGNKF